MAKRNGNSRKGFASMPKKKVKEIAAKGGRASRGGGRQSREEASFADEDNTGTTGGTWSGY